MHSIHIRVGQRLVRRAIGEGIRQALLAFGNSLATEQVEVFDLFQIGRLGLLRGLQDTVHAFLAGSFFK